MARDDLTIYNSIWCTGHSRAHPNRIKPPSVDREKTLISTHLKITCEMYTNCLSNVYHTDEICYSIQSNDMIRCKYYVDKLNFKNTKLSFMKFYTPNQIRGRGFNVFMIFNLQDIIYYECF